MGFASLVLLAANVVYATSYVVTRVVLDDVPPTILALLRLVIGAAVLVPLSRRVTVPQSRQTPPGQGARVFWMGALGFAAAFALSHCGIAGSSATNAALLIVVEPLTLVALGPLLLGERQRRAGPHARGAAALARRHPSHPVGRRLRLVLAARSHRADRHQRHRDHRALDRLGHAGDDPARRAGMGGRRATGRDGVRRRGDAVPGARDHRRRLPRLELGAGAGRGRAGGAVPDRAAGDGRPARGRRPRRAGDALHRARRRARRPRPLDDRDRPALSVY